MGWDSHREQFFYGYHLYEIVASNKKHDLPLALRLDPGSTSDFVALAKTLEHLRKTLRDNDLATLTAAMSDAGHDGEEIYRFLLHHNILPIIALKTAAPAFHPAILRLCLPEASGPTSIFELIGIHCRASSRVTLETLVAGDGVN
ncbi:MAG: transposase [Pseudomonadota bacterium]